MSNETLNPIEMTVTFKSNKAGKSESMTFGDLPESSQMAIIRYGAMRFINDKLGGKEGDELAAAFDDIFFQLREGWIDRRGTGGGGSSADPIETEALKLARDRIKAALKAKGVPLKSVDKAKLAELTSAMYEKDKEALREQAEKILAMKTQSLDLGGLDLDSLGI